EHGITPESVRRSVKEGIEREAAAHEQVSRAAGVNSEEIITLDYLDELEKEMLQAADELDFERAAQLRDRIEAMREKVGQQTTVFQFDLEEKKKRGRRGRRGGESNRARIPKPER
ncbi:MAG: UvrB/UvrC motif-containing protein, partial [Thermoguttaceae bacterium]|nr:UvrB/UvrC motif-containing protein [Thermoguttaceae bacterium]